MLLELDALAGLKWMVSLLVGIVGFVIVGYLRWSHKEMEMLKESFSKQEKELMAMASSMALQDQRQSLMFEAIAQMQANQQSMNQKLEQLILELAKKNVL